MDWDDASYRSACASIRECMKYGRGFNAIKYHASDAAVRQQFADIPFPDIAINYIPDELAMLAMQPASEKPLLQPIRAEHLIDAKREAIHLLSCEIRFVDGRLRCAWTYSENVYQETTITMYMQRCMLELSKFVKVLGGQDQSSW